MCLFFGAALRAGAGGAGFTARLAVFSALCFNKKFTVVIFVFMLKLKQRQIRLFYLLYNQK